MIFDIYTIANWFTGFVEAYCLYVLCKTFMNRREKWSKFIYFSGFLCAGILINVCNSIFSITILNIAVIIMIEFTVSFLYKGSLKMRLLSTFLTATLAVLTEVMVLIVLTALFSADARNVISEGAFRLLGIVLSKLLYYGTVKFIKFKFRHELTGHGTKYWILFAIMFIVTTITMFTFCKVLEENTSPYIRNLSLASSCGLSVATVIVLMLYESSFKQNHMIAKNKLSEVKLKEQIKHYNDIMMTQGQVKKIRHDLENHLLAIKAIVQKQEYDECLNYVDNLLNDMDKSNSYINTGNTVLDAIISAKQTEAEKNGIAFHSKIRIPAMLPISHEDECVIFGNALDNAIEAAIKAPNEKFVDISLVYDKETLICQISNSCIDDSEAITTKADYKNHGIGRYNIQEVLKKYNSVSKTVCENNKYTLSIIFMGLNNKE